MQQTAVESSPPLRLTAEIRHPDGRYPFAGPIFVVVLPSRLWRQLRRQRGRCEHRETRSEPTQQCRLRVELSKFVGRLQLDVFSTQCVDDPMQSAAIPADRIASPVDAAAFPQRSLQQEWNRLLRAGRIGSAQRSGGSPKRTEERAHSGASQLLLPHTALSPSLLACCCFCFLLFLSVPPAHQGKQKRRKNKKKWNSSRGSSSAVSGR